MTEILKTSHFDTWLRGLREMIKKHSNFSRYDSADYLETEADIAAYLDAAMSDDGGDDPAFVAHTLGVVARARNFSQLARDTGISREGLYKALSEDGNPSFSTISKVAGALGLRITFEPVIPIKKLGGQKKSA